MMLRKLLLAAVVGVAGYVIGVRAGFDASVRDYYENDAKLLERIADEKDKFDYTDSDDGDGSDEEPIDISATFG